MTNRRLTWFDIFVFYLNLEKKQSFCILVCVYFFDSRLPYISILGDPGDPVDLGDPVDPGDPTDLGDPVDPGDPPNYVIISNSKPIISGQPMIRSFADFHPPTLNLWRGYDTYLTGHQFYDVSLVISWIFRL